MEQHVRILGWASIVYGGLLLLIAAGLFVVIGGAGVISGDRQAMLVTGAVGTFIAVLLIILALPSFIVGFGLLRFRPWARIVGIVLSVLHLFSFPIGTILGVYGLWVLLNAQTLPLFEGPRAATAV